MPDPSQAPPGSALARDGARFAFGAVRRRSPIALMVALGGGLPRWRPVRPTRRMRRSPHVTIRRTRTAVRRRRRRRSSASAALLSMVCRPADSRPPVSAPATSELSAAGRQSPEDHDAGPCGSFRALGSTAVVVVTESTSARKLGDLVRRSLEAVDRACSRFRGDSELTGSTPRRRPRLGQPVAGPCNSRRAERCADDCGSASTRRSARSFVRPATTARSRSSASARRGGSPRSHPLARRGRTSTRRRAPNTASFPKESSSTSAPLPRRWAADRRRPRDRRLDRSRAFSSRLGGDIAVAGPAPAWRLVRANRRRSRSAARPTRPDRCDRDRGLATSSTSVRRWQTDRGEAHHILDPRTGRPAAPAGERVRRRGDVRRRERRERPPRSCSERQPHWLATARLPARLVGADGAVVSGRRLAPGGACADDLAAGNGDDLWYLTRGLGSRCARCS